MCVCVRARARVCVRVLLLWHALCLNRFADMFHMLLAFHNIKKKSFACPNMTAPATYAHSLTFNAANL